MALSISCSDARRFLVAYHFQPATVPAVVERLQTVQYDPLRVVGRNPDLVFQARVSDYGIDEWERRAYADRLIYDAWDKQACLVPVDQWAMRAPIRSDYLAWHDRSVLDDNPGAVAQALAEIDAQGPLSSLEFSDRSRVNGGHTWHGPTRIKRILRALWLRGVLVTHHRAAGRHYYDRPERVLPDWCIAQAPPSLHDYHRWIVLHRHRAVGLLRRSAEAAIWSACGDASTRLTAISELVEARELLPVHVDKSLTLFHLPAAHSELLDASAPARVVRILAPLDNLLWDRRAVELIFGFKYTWEVYKKEHLRSYGYYVLPVLYGDRFVARIDSRLERGAWNVLNFWWEPGVEQDIEVRDALRDAAARFKRYLGARDVRVSRTVDLATRRALRPS